MPLTRLLPALLCLALSACASLNEAECRRGDWQALGQKEGLAGYAAQRLDDHRKACGKYAIQPDSALWENGRQQGLKQFCTPHNAVEAGYRGYYYTTGTCPADMEAAFLPGWRIGNDAWRAERELEQLRQRIRNMELDLARLKPGPQRDAVEREYRYSVGIWGGMPGMFSSQLSLAEHNAWRARERMWDYQRKLATPAS
ncbi:DUF2799 domain-containing protein [Viridibacterium curvum]|uniref:DUF2799 domain-containing protein n=1 Tax=Viridibacterium curvum TaxID=1101404 RepID=A0ABP9QR10_9RHOO